MNREEFNMVFNSFHVPHNAEELFWLVKIVESLDPRVIIEIGVEGGGSFKFWEQLLPPEFGILIGIDPQHPKTMIKWDWEHSDRKVHVLEGYSYEHYIIKSVEKILDGMMADFLFIDAEHASAAAKQDFENYSPFVRSGGVVGFHDLNDIRDFWNSLNGRKEAILKSIGTGGWHKP